MLDSHPWIGQDIPEGKNADPRWMIFFSQTYSYVFRLPLGVSMMKENESSL